MVYTRVLCSIRLFLYIKISNEKREVYLETLCNYPKIKNNNPVLQEIKKINVSEISIKNVLTDILVGISSLFSDHFLIIGPLLSGDHLEFRFLQQCLFVFEHSHRCESSGH